jgi:uncharacterized protein (DUF433 family)
MKAGISPDRILAAYPAITNQHLNLLVAYAETNLLLRRARRLQPWPGAPLVKSGQILKRKG